MQGILAYKKNCGKIFEFAADINIFSFHIRSSSFYNLSPPWKILFNLQILAEKMFKPELHVLPA